MTQPVTQRSFVKGIDASTDKFDQPRGSLPRLSNLLFTRRGALITVDGSSPFSTPSNRFLPIANQGSIVAMQQYLNGVLPQQIFYLQDSTPGTKLGEVTGLTATGINTAGGTLTPGNTYTYGVSVFDGQQNASAGATTSIVLGGGNNAVRLTWNVKLGAGSYLIQGNTGPITNLTTRIGQVFQPDFQQNVSGPISSPTVTFTDKTGAGVALSNNPYGGIVWGTDLTVGTLNLFTAQIIPAAATGSYFDPIHLATFPCRSNDIAIPGFPPLDASGGLIGASGQVPQMIQFANLIIIALGNGLRPQSTDGVTVSPFTNTFTAIYITWAASTTYLVGDLVIPPTPNGHYYKCTQGGQSQTPGPPAFSTTTGQATIDGQAAWVEAGLVTNSPPPRGAAHVAYHAGSLWWLNSSPANSSDNLDGPSVLGMSDTNSVVSFNPVNRAFIGKDDGSEGMGLASFTIAEFGISPLGSLIAFKNFSTYQITGVFGAQDFTIQQLQTNMGCVAPRSIQYLSGFGIMRLSHLGFAMTDGVRDKLLSEQIRPFIFGSPAVGSAGIQPIRGIDLAHAYLVKADQITSPPMYAAAVPVLGSGGTSNIALNRIFLYDLVLKAWGIIDLPITTNPTNYISSIYQIRTPGYNPLTVIGGFDNGSIQIIQNGDPLWVNMISASQSVVKWALTTAEIFNTNDPSGEIYVSNLLIRGTNLDGSPITVTLNIMDETGTVADPRVYNVGKGEFQLMIGINEQAISFNAMISGSGRVELESFTWNVQPKTSGIPVVIS